MTKFTTFDDLLYLTPDEKESLGLVHTPAEIQQQPATWLQTYSDFAGIGRELARFLKAAGLDEISQQQMRVTLIGAGTSDYIGRAVESLLKQKWRCDVNAIPSTTLMTEMDALISSASDATRHIWISFSRSGDSYEGVVVLEKALEKYPDIQHIIVTCNADGRMAAELASGRANVFCITLDDAVNDRGLAMTSSFTNMVVAGHCLAHISELDAYRPVVDRLASIGASLLPKAGKLAACLANESFSRICFLGSGALKAAGDESALKTMELTAGHYSVMSESFLGLRHGPLSWLNAETLVVGFVSNEPGKRGIEVGLIHELQRKKAAGSVVLIGHGTEDISGIASDHVVHLDETIHLPDEYRAPVGVMFAQCLGVFASLHLGFKPDTPSADGKIQRVVSNISFG